MGLLNGIAFRPPSGLSLRAPFQAFKQIHPGMFGQVLVMRLFRDHGFLTQMCGNNFMVWKAAPPLIASEEQVDSYIVAVRTVVEQVHSSPSFWSEALGMARRAIGSV